MTAALGNQARNRTALLQGVFDGQRVGDIRVLFKVRPVKLGSQHFGSRLLWLPDGTLLMSVGDGGNPPLRIGDRLARDQAQNLAVHLGKILRLTEDGLPAPGNPYLNQSGVQPEIWTRGHRNIQGLALAPNGRVWATEHGPRGGDELNVIKGGRNYGWPLQSRGFDYNTGEPVGQPVVPGMKHPKTWWTPSIATSGLTVYSGPHFPRWQGNVFAGGLVSQDLRRLVVDGNGKVLKEVRLPIGARVRDVRQGPDGFLYVLTDEDNGRLLRIEPL
jgi:glucose/arabinose dehydrogenase